MKEIYHDNQQTPITHQQIDEKLLGLISKPIHKVFCATAGILHFKIGEKLVFAQESFTKPITKYTLVIWGDWNYFYESHLLETSMRIEASLEEYNKRMGQFINILNISSINNIDLAEDFSKMQIIFNDMSILDVEANPRKFFNIHIFGQEFICVKNALNHSYSEPITLIT